MALAMAIITRIATNAGLSKKGANKALKLLCNSGGEVSGSTGCMSRYRIDSVMDNELSSLVDKM